MSREQDRKRETYDEALRSIVSILGRKAREKAKAQEPAPSGAPQVPAQPTEAK